MKRRVVVTGLGIISPIGCAVDIFWDNCVGVCEEDNPINAFFLVLPLVTKLSKLYT